MKILSVFTAFCGLLSAAHFACAQEQQHDVTSAQVNGTWESKSGAFKIWALGEQKLQVEFSGVYEYKQHDGSPMANAGAGKGIAIINGQTAKFKPEDSEEECAITMKFVKGRLEVEQEGRCGFGRNVTAAGTYRKTNSHKPVFDLP